MRIRARSLRAASVATGVAAAMTLASCGGSSQVASSTVATSSTLVVGSLPATSTTTTTSTTSTTTTTTSTSTTSTTTTTVTPTTNPATTQPPATDPPPADTPQTAFVAADERLLEIDVATGATVRVLDELFTGEGIFRGWIRLSPDASTIWFSEGYEDGWYGCDSSIGSIGRVDVETGTIEIAGVGSGVEPSDDGALIVYVTSGLCLPDPELPEAWVLTPSDRVVVRTLATGEEREFVTDAPPENYESPGTVVGAVFGPGGNLLVLLGDGRLIDVDVDGSGVIQDHPVALPELTGTPIAATADSLITAEFGDEGGTDAYSIDLDSGAATLIASAGAFMAVGVSDDDHVVVASFEPVTVAPGASVTVVELPDGPYPNDIDW